MQHKTTDISSDGLGGFETQTVTTYTREEVKAQLDQAEADLEAALFKRNLLAKLLSQLVKTTTEERSL